WHGPRRAEFLKWAAEHGLDWHSDAANMGFMEHELQTPQYAGLLAQLRQAQSGTDAAALGHQYESGGSDYFRAQHMAEGERFAHLPSPHAPHTSATAPAPHARPTAMEETL
ncbi:phage tail tip lysozyme, partial [Acidisphaera rubrifaciens]|uniref:phage tail tip lysozyme n=1 Tax=Acidisphaera rubrifaciens TaxID=50715 RepID=UPI0006628187